VIGGALLNQEKVASFVKMFNQYDVVIFNHRGVAYDKSSILKPKTWSYWLSSVCVDEGFQGSQVTFGAEEEKDVFAVIYDIFKRKAYKKIYGLALCYSAPIFIKAAALRPGIFDKLILDGCWIYVKNMIKRYIEFSYGEKRGNYCYAALSEKENTWTARFFSWYLEKISGVKFRSIDFDFVPYLNELNIPVLFVHSINDAIVSSSEFEDIWEYIPSEQKAAILTTCDHIRNHLKQKEFYKYMANSFFENSFEDFLASLRLTRATSENKILPVARFLHGS